MKMRSKIYSLLFIFLLSCNVAETESIIQNSEEEQTIEDQEEQEEEITTEEIKMIKPIPEYQNYFFTNNGALFGLDESGATRINITDDEENPINIADFFIKKGDLYLIEITIDNTDPENPVETEIYHKQSGGEVTTVTSLPTRPTLSRSQLNTEEFTIENFDYEGKMCSDVRNLKIESGVERFFMVDGFLYLPDVGLFFNVSDGRYNETTMVRDKALYFWPVNKPSINVVLDPGKLW